MKQSSGLTRGLVANGALAVIVALSLGGAFTLETAADFTTLAIRAIANITPR